VNCRTAAVEYAGVCGKVAALPDCKQAMASDNPDLQHAGAMACSLLGDDAGVALLQQRAEIAGDDALAAGSAVLSQMQRAEACSWIQALVENADSERLGIRLAGVSGYKELASVLLQAMRNPDLAQLGFAAFHQVFGVRMDESELILEPADDPDGEADDDPDLEPPAAADSDGLPSPDVHALTAWWMANQQRFEDGQRFSLGATISDAHLLHLLVSAEQPTRRNAAFEAALSLPERALFNSSAPASRQQVTLGL
jgi:uncharacterized protein (TIGR02270 family)